MTRRCLMYLLVGLQMVVLSAMVASQELNMALDSGAAVDLEITQARARKDPFRGASVWGASALELDARDATVPAERLRRGDKVLVFFSTDASRRPFITRVERAGIGAPPFGATRFTIPGTVRDEAGTERFSAGEGTLMARVGNPPVHIGLSLPASIPVDDAALGRLSGPSLIRAGLHRGFLGRRYFTDVRLVGRSWPFDVSFVFDEARERLLVLAPREATDGVASSGAKPRSDVFFFDALGHETGTVEVAGRLIDGVMDPTDGRLLALVSDTAWGLSEMYLARIGDDGQVVQRGSSIALDRVRGFDQTTGSAWVLAGYGSLPPQPPYFVERMALGAVRGLRLGLFASLPRTVVSVGNEVWVVETGLHRISRLNLASGSVLMEYRDVNGPTDIAVDAGSLYVVEANRTQLTKIGSDGRVLWRVPRFEGLEWILPVPGTAGGWAGATAFEGTSGGVFHFGPDGSISRIKASTRPELSNDWQRRRLGVKAARSTRDGRVYLLERHAIVILGADGSLTKRVDGFRFAQDQRLRG